MAKLASKRFHEVDRIGFTRTINDVDEMRTYDGIIVKRSDGKFLRRFTGDTATGYSILTGIPASVTTVAECVAYLGYTTNDTQTLRRL